MGVGALQDRHGGKLRVWKAAAKQELKGQLVVAKSQVGGCRGRDCMRGGGGGGGGTGGRGEGGRR